MDSFIFVFFKKKFYPSESIESRDKLKKKHLYAQIWLDFRLMS